MDCSPPGSSVHEILQARILEWLSIFINIQNVLPQGDNLLHPPVKHCEEVKLTHPPQSEACHSRGHLQGLNSLFTLFPHLPPSLIHKRTWHPGPAAAAAAAKSLQLCSTLCYPTDGSLPGSPVPGILQARTLEWVAISFSNA